MALCSTLCLMDGMERGVRGSQQGQGTAGLRPGHIHCPLATSGWQLAMGLSSVHAAWHGGALHTVVLPTVTPTSPLLLSQMGLSMHWGEWVQTPLPRHWSVSTSRRRTTGNHCPPCPPPATGLPSSCKATRSSSWVGAAGASQASPCTPVLSFCCLPGPGSNLVHPGVAPCCPPTPALQPTGPILLAEPTDGAGLGHRQPQHLICAQGAGRASCLSPPLRPSIWRRGAGRATPVCPAAAPSPPAPWPTVSSSAWGGCSSQGRTTSIPVPTLSTPWRCLIPHRVSAVSLGGVGASTAGPGCLLWLGEGCPCPKDTVHPGSDHQPLAPVATPALAGELLVQACPGLRVRTGPLVGNAHTFSSPGAWSKSSRAIRMREKRADFVAGCLGGRVVAVGGLGNARGRSVAMFLSPSFVAHQ